MNDHREPEHTHRPTYAGDGCDECDRLFLTKYGSPAFTGVLGDGGDAMTIKKVLLSFTSCHDQDGGSAKLATLEQAIQFVRDANPDLAGEIPTNATSFDYYEFGEAGHQVSWGNSVKFDYHEHLKEDGSRFELRVDGEVVVSKTEGAEDEEEGD